MERFGRIVAATVLVGGITAGISVIAAAPAVAQSTSDTMGFGHNVAPPRGFLELCRRDPVSCSEGEGGAAITEALRQTDDASKTYWLTRVRTVSQGSGLPASASASGHSGARMIARPASMRGWRNRGALGIRTASRWSRPSEALVSTPVISPVAVTWQVLPSRKPEVLPAAGGPGRSFKPFAWVAPPWSSTQSIADRLSTPPTRRLPQQQVVDWSSVTLTSANALTSAEGLPTVAEREAPFDPAASGHTLIREVPTPSVARGGDLWGVVSRVNTAVNRAIRSQSDVQAFGGNDVWQTAANGPVTAGDCEDFVVEKRRRLLAAGVPSAAMSIAIVTTPWRETHAVLLVATTDGDYVLDNLTPWIVRWTDAGYRWNIRQTPGRPLNWVSIASVS